ncbi:hypothetical protein C8J55DRAFT_488287 [Lentinula edodes]|uniref:Uncharacterized protein n=1 Tax=Lentinula lateritia TaxID=40482 RepID=A0A9W9AK10_9AGAR|nr:hypothetical protein C8J55DRAFT_488287 [Lentinula edodes]
MSSAQIELFSTSQPNECSNASMDKVDYATLKYTPNVKAYQAPNNDFQTAQYSASYTEVNLLAETYLSQSTAPLTNPLLTSKCGTELSQMISYESEVLLFDVWIKRLTTHMCLAESTISIYDASKPYLFNNKLPHYIDVAILEQCGFTEWTMLKRVSQFHYRNICTFIDARFLYQLERYVKEAVPLFRMLDNTRSLIAGQFFLKFLNLFVPNRNVEPPLLIFAPNDTQQAWLIFAEYNEMLASITAVPVIFEEFCSSYMEIKGLRNTRIRVLFGKTKSALPLILASTETMGYGFLNSKGLYMGYPLDVLNKVCGGRWVIVQEVAIHGGQWASLLNFSALFKYSRRSVAGK